MNTYQEIREQLLSRYDEILLRVNQIEYDRRRVAEPLDRDLDDQAINLENNEVLDQLNLVERVELNMIFEALTRLETGQYGRCLSCGDLISEKRLEALPYTLTCLPCAKELDENEQKNRFL